MSNNRNRLSRSLSSGPEGNAKSGGGEANFPTMSSTSRGSVRLPNSGASEISHLIKPEFSYSTRSLSAFCWKERRKEWCNFSQRSGCWKGTYIHRLLRGSTRQTGFSRRPRWCILSILSRRPFPFLPVSVGWFALEGRDSSLHHSLSCPSSVRLTLPGDGSPLRMAHRTPTVVGTVQPHGNLRDGLSRG